MSRFQRSWALFRCSVRVVGTNRKLLVFPIVTLSIFDLFPSARGATSSLQSFTSLLFGTVMMGLAAPVLSASLAALAGVACVAAFAAWCMWRWAERHSHRYRQKTA
jgi:DHA1 family bicyclomycin/chloramphenicol resistance-like MFS transporter